MAKRAVYVDVRVRLTAREREALLFSAGALDWTPERQELEIQDRLIMACEALIDGAVRYQQGERAIAAMKGTR